MSAVVVLEWKFSPPNYLEEVKGISYHDCTLEILNGIVEAKIDSATYDADPTIREEITQYLDSWFFGVQLLTHKDYQLIKSGMKRVYSNGRISTCVEPGLLKLYLSINPVDTSTTDYEGLIFDSKKDRIEKERKLAELFRKYRDTDNLLISLYHSYRAAVHDPKNEFLYLYEIRDSLSAKFGGETAAEENLGISNPQWSRLGLLCNDPSLQQGRHRGKTGGVLRDASAEELTEARNIARVMIESYLNYLEAFSGHNDR